MAKGKKSKRKGVVSKGERPNVSRSAIKSARAEKKRFPEVKDLLKSFYKKQQVMEKPQSQKEHELRKKYTKEYEEEVESARLMNKFGECGLTRAAAIQAVKTNKIPDLSQKWSKILANHKKKEKNSSSIMGKAFNG